MKSEAAKAIYKIFRVQAGKVGSDIIVGYFRAGLLLLLGTIFGAIITANNINPRVTAVEIIQSAQTSVNEAVRADISVLKVNDIERKIQIQMLITYLIPASEREKMRQQAEQQIISNTQTF